MKEEKTEEKDVEKKKVGEIIKKGVVEIDDKKESDEEEDEGGEWGVVRERRGVRERKGRGRRGRVVKVGE